MYTKSYFKPQDIGISLDPFQCAGVPMLISYQKWYSTDFLQTKDSLLQDHNPSSADTRQRGASPEDFMFKKEFCGVKFLC